MSSKAGIEPTDLAVLPSLIPSWVSTPNTEFPPPALPNKIFLPSTLNSNLKSTICDSMLFISSSTYGRVSDIIS